jgi:hypothetical protein
MCWRLSDASGVAGDGEREDAPVAEEEDMEVEGHRARLLDQELMQ